MSAGYNAFFVICASQVVFVILEACLLLSSVKYHRNELVKTLNMLRRTGPRRGREEGSRPFRIRLLIMRVRAERNTEQLFHECALDMRS